MDLASLPTTEARTHLLQRACNPRQWMNSWESQDRQSQADQESGTNKGELAPSISSRLNEARKLRKEGRTTQAAATLKASIAELDQSNAHPAHKGDAHAALAVTYQEAGLWEGAVAHYMHSIDLFQKAGSHDNASLLVTLYNNLAMVCRELGRSEEAELAYVTAIEFHDTHLGPNAPDSLATLYGNLAYLYHDMGLCEAAYDMQRLAAEVIKTHTPDDQFGLMHATRRAGIFAATGGRMPEAARCFEHARKLLSEMQSAPESTHTELVINEATSFLAMNRDADALALYERASAAIRSRVNPDELLLALVENNIGCILLRQKKYEESVLALINSHDLQRNHPAADLSARAEVLHNLALAYDGTQNLAAARAYRETARQLLEFVSDDVKQKLSTAEIAGEAVPSESVTKEANPAERAYVRLPVHVASKKKGGAESLVVPLRTETINWL